MKLDPISIGGIVIALVSSIYMSLWVKNDVYVLFPVFLLFGGLFMFMLFRGRGEDIPTTEIVESNILFYYTTIGFIFIVLSSYVSKIYVPPRMALVGFPLLAFSVMIAISEEIFFRGGLLSFFDWIGLPDITSILASSLAFTIYHFAVYQSINSWVFVFCSGLVLAYITERSGSLTPAIIAHVLNNMMVMIRW